jgi:molecular chaperone GrpE
MAKKKPDKTIEEEKPAEWQAALDELKSGWQRTQAEFDNYRKRMESARLEWAKMATASAMLKMTPILDDLRRAFAHVPAEQNTSAWVTGMRQVEKHLRTILADANLIPIEDGGEFDPNLHEAIAYEDHPELSDGTIIDVIEIGWKLGDKVIKPARVRVSRGQTSD